LLFSDKPMQKKKPDHWTGMSDPMI